MLSPNIRFPLYILAITIAVSGAVSAGEHTCGRSGPGSGIYNFSIRWRESAFGAPPPGCDGFRARVYRGGADSKLVEVATEVRMACRDRGVIDGERVYEYVFYNIPFDADFTILAASQGNWTARSDRGCGLGGAVGMIRLTEARPTARVSVALDQSWWACP